MKRRIFGLWVFVGVVALSGSAATTWAGGRAKPKHSSPLGVVEASRASFVQFLREFRDHLDAKDANWLALHAKFPLRLVKQSGTYRRPKPKYLRIRDAKQLAQNLSWSKPDDCDWVIDLSAPDDLNITRGTPPRNKLEKWDERGPLYAAPGRAWVEVTTCGGEDTAVTHVLEFALTENSWEFVGHSTYFFDSNGE